MDRHLLAVSNEMSKLNPDRAAVANAASAAAPAAGAGAAAAGATVEDLIARAYSNQIAQKMISRNVEIQSTSANGKESVG